MTKRLIFDSIENDFHFGPRTLNFFLDPTDASVATVGFSNQSGNRRMEAALGGNDALYLSVKHR